MAQDNAGPPSDDTLEERLKALGFGTLKSAGAEVLQDRIKAWAQDCRSMPGELQRQVYIEEAAKAMKGVVGSPKTVLGAAMRDAQPKDDDASGAGSSSNILFEDPEPWENPVDGGKLLDELAVAIKKYLFLPPGAPDVIAAWALFTYLWDAFDVYPIINVTSVVPGCGKTTLADVLNTLVNRPLKCEHATGAALYRTIELYSPTLIIDEADSFLDGNEEHRGLVNSGTRRGGCVIRCVGDDHVPRKFSTVGPRAILGIGKRDATVYDRSISFDLQRKTETDKVERITSIVRMEKGLLPHRRKMRRWADDHFTQLQGSDPQMPDLRTDRAHDNWRPLFAIAGLVGGDWPERVQEAALAIDGRGTAGEDANVKILLLHDVDRIFEKREESTLRSKSICEDLAQMEDRPWPEWSRGSVIVPSALARQLKGFKIKPKAIRFGENTYSGYHRDNLKDALNRYPAPDKAKQPKQPSNDGDNRGDSTQNKDPDVLVTEPPESPYEASTVVGVLDGANGVPERPATCMSRLDVPAGDAPESDLFDDYETAEREAIQNEPF